MFHMEHYGIRRPERYARQIGLRPLYRRHERKAYI